MYEILELSPCSPLFSFALWAGAPPPALREFSNSNTTLFSSELQLAGTDWRILACALREWMGYEPGFGYSNIVLYGKLPRPLFSP